MTATASRDTVRGMGEFQLSEEQLRQVMERAIELDATGHGRRTWDLASIEALGAEIGVSSTAIKAAWIEASTTGASLPYGEHVVDPAPIALTRVVNEDPASAVAAMQRWFLHAGFAPVRHSEASALLERTGRLKERRLSGIRQVVLDVRALPSEQPETFVRVALGRKRPGRSRSTHEIYQAAKGWLLLDGVVVLLSEAVTIEHGLLASPAALAAGAGQGWWRARRKARRIDDDARLAVEGLLDVLEHRGPAAIDAAPDE